MTHIPVYHFMQDKLCFFVKLCFYIGNIIMAHFLIKEINLQIGGEKRRVPALQYYITLLAQLVLCEQTYQLFSFMRLL